MASRWGGCQSGEDCLKYAKNFFNHAQQEFIHSQLVQIGQNTLWEKNWTGWYKIQFGQNGLGKGWLLGGYRLLKIPIWSKLVFKGWPTSFYLEANGPDRPNGIGKSTSQSFWWGQLGRKTGMIMGWISRHWAKCIAKRSHQAHANALVASATSRKRNYVAHWSVSHVILFRDVGARIRKRKTFTATPCTETAPFGTTGTQYNVAVRSMWTPRSIAYNII